MSRKKLDTTLPGFVAGLCIIAAIALVGTLAVAFADDLKQERFATPEKAVDALIAANRSGNMAELMKILGPQATKLISSGDAVADKEGRGKFVAAYDTAHKLESQSDDRDILVIGENEWPLPIPLVREHGKWRFDSAAGEEEILNRRIGRNELNSIEVCRAYVEAQREYGDEHVLAHGKHEYAEHFMSHVGKHDGLYWPANENEKESPLGPFVAFAEAEGNAQSRQPYQGYYYKILTGQTEKAPGGAMNYVVNGHMTGGYALLAFPAKYGDSGIMTFIINQNGIVHEKDFGPDTAKIAAHIKQYNPDESWNIP